MKTEQILMYVVTLILGMLFFHMLKNVCSCKLVEGQVTTAQHEDDLYACCYKPNADPPVKTCCDIKAAKEGCDGPGGGTSCCEYVISNMWNGSAVCARMEAAEEAARRLAAGTTAPIVVSTQSVDRTAERNRQMVQMMIDGGGR